ncbi:ABC transporter substrate-binding protein [Brevibacillus daliensis]|uniref:ABC transporter substrate-binding protein n=1 Tax=Brevibacillus daliensis TaxID=2892995 RepID=UPI001E4F0045|nr:ABC transporter substrate-binding protein [Brevibacillus daliensis]
MLARMKSSLLLVILCLSLVVSACSASPANTGESSSKPVTQSGTATADESVDLVRLTWGDSGYPSPFAFSPSGPGGYLRNSFLFDTLTWKDESGVIPWLAKSWEISKDELTYTFKLEQDVTWHDGKPFTAEDVVFSFNYYKKFPFNWTGDFSHIESVTKSDDYTVVFTIKNKYAAFLSDLVGIVPIIPKHVWEKVDKPVEFRDDAALVGTGPYTLKQYDEKSGQYLYAANPNYFKGEVLVKEVAYVNSSNKVLSLQNKEIDAGYTVNYSEVENMLSQGFKMIQSDPTGSALRITFNLDHPQLKDKRLRQAIAYALDREEMSRKITGGDPIVGNAGIIPPDSPWYNNSVKQYEYNITKAERILDELGYTKNANGIRELLKLKVMVSSTSQESQVMQEMLKKVGIELNIQQVDSAAFTAAMGENKYDMAITGHIGLSGDPDYLRLWFMGQASNTYAARGKTWKNEDFQRLAIKQMQELDFDKRKAIIGKMQDILAEELPTLVLYHRPFYFMYNPDVYNRWTNTYGGIADGIPLWDNKVFFIDVKK